MTNANALNVLTSTVAHPSPPPSPQRGEGKGEGPYGQDIRCVCINYIENEVSSKGNGKVGDSTLRDARFVKGLCCSSSKPVLTGS